MAANNIQAFQAQQAFGYNGNAVMMGHNLPGAGFSYASNEIGYGDGNWAGKTAVGALNGAYKAGSFAVGAMGAAAGYRAGGAMGALRGAAMAGGPLLGAGLAFGGHVFSNMMEGQAEQQSMQSMLGQNHQFINGGSRTGRGFSRADTKAISDFTRELSSLPELMTSFGELKNIMEKVAQSGVMNGVRNAQEYQRRMRETITTLKDVSKIMSTTMEEATQFFADARQSGMYSPQMIKMNAMQRQFTAGVTGMNQNQIGQLQMQGANTSFATGGFRGSGAQSALRSARQIGMANEMGLISDDRIAELTGMEGAAGIQALAGGLTNAAQVMAQGSMGTAMSIALGKQDKSGRFTGAIDEELAEKVRMGGISKEQLLSLAHKKASSQVAKISFKSQENKLRSEMASRVGVEGMGMELQDILGGAGWQNPDAVNLVMQRYGLDERTAKIVQEMGNALPSIQRELGSKAQTEGRRMAEQSYMKENMSTDAIKNKLLKRLENTFSEPFKKMGGDLSNLVSGYVEETMDSFLGRYSTNITKQTSTLASGSLGGSKTAQVEMNSLLSGAKGLNLRPGMTKADSMGEAFISTLTGQNSANADKFRFLEGLSAKGMATPVIKGSGGTIAGYTQDSARINAAKQYLGNLQAGKGTEKLAGDVSGAMTSLRKDIGNVLREHGAAMKDMTQSERINFIRSKVGGSMSDLAYLEKNGVTIEEIISEVQHKEGLMTHLGAVNFNKYASELYGTGDFGGAREMSIAEKTSREQLAGAFGDQKSNVISLLANDSKGRDLFLSAASGNMKDSADARKLLTQEMPLEEREKLAKKFGLTADQSLHIAGIYGGAQGADVSKLAQASMGNISKSSLGGLAAQLRRQGIDISERLGKSGLGINDATASIYKLAESMSGLTSVDKMSSFLGGSGAGQIDAALSAAAGLTGKDREKALAALGSGATSAIGYGDYITRQAQRGKGLGFQELKEKLSEDEYAWAKEHAHGGSLSRKDAEELGRMARNRAYAGGLTAAGTVSAKEGNAQKEYLENLNRFAQTTAQFAELVIQATPQLAENVKKAKEAIQQSTNIVPDGPNMSGGN